jgi:alkylation response protein AidB-like acyl-CoA dehydrogenase
METQVEAMRLNGLRFVTKQLRGEPLGAETSINKLIRARIEIESGRLARDIEGTFGVLARKSPHAVDNGRWQKVMLSWPPFVIGGGTPNIQKNVIAERILGLPHDV